MITVIVMRTFEITASLEYNICKVKHGNVHITNKMHLTSFECIKLALCIRGRETNQLQTSTCCSDSVSVTRMSFYL